VEREKRTLEPSAALLFAIGLFGSVHCVAMCGSIAGALALSLPPECRRSLDCLARFLAAYNLGRVASYTVAGGVGGFIGSALSGALLFPWTHEAPRILASVVVILVGLYLTGWVPQLKQMDRLGSPLWQRLEPLGRRLLPVRRLWNAFLYGTLWGWLPCGLVYYALVLTLASANAAHGALFMLLFGLGTLPAVAGVGTAAGWLTALARNRYWQGTAGLLLVAAGILDLLFGEGFF
jgi:sulfite exporter TauE/SafE